MNGKIVFVKRYNEVVKVTVERITDVLSDRSPIWY